MINEASLALIRLHGHYKNQLLYVEGGLMSQPNTYLEAMQLIESTKG